MAAKQKFLKPKAAEKTYQAADKSGWNFKISADSIKRVLMDPNHSSVALAVVFVLEIFINILVIQRVNYTEIDWKAYMQEVEGPINGTFNYSLIKGDTGPLVYPAGFVWIFTGFYAVTNHGENIRLAQYLFLVVYLINLLLVFRIYMKAKKVPPYVMVLTCITSYRVHSIYVLRLFNDPIAMLFFFAAINAFLEFRWYLGSVLYSLAVSVKMNILLFSPALLLTYILCLGFVGTIKQLAVCALLQLFLAAPFLLCDPYAYLVGSFDLGRVFLYQWTVNWRFMPEVIFVHKLFHISLLGIHATLIIIFYKYAKLSLESYAKLSIVKENIKGQLKNVSKFNMNSLTQLFLTPLFLCNLIGIACSRSLHYQFYVWYFNTLPYLAWCTNYTTPVRLMILGLIEMCWNTFPSTIYSSLLLHSAHITLLVGIYLSQAKTLSSKSMKS